MRFPAFKNLLPHVWGDWNEWELKCWYDLIRRLCVYGDCSLMDCFHCPLLALLQALGGWPARAVSTGSLLSDFQSDGPVGALGGQPCREGRLGRRLLVISLQGGQWEVLAPFRTCATQPFQTLIPIATFPHLQACLGEWQYTVITVLGYWLLPCSFPVSCLYIGIIHLLASHIPASEVAICFLPRPWYTRCPGLLAAYKWCKPKL